MPVCVDEPVPVCEDDAVPVCEEEAMPVTELEEVPVCEGAMLAERVELLQPLEAVLVREVVRVWALEGELLGVDAWLPRLGEAVGVGVEEKDHCITTAPGEGGDRLPSTLHI